LHRVYAFATAMLVVENSLGTLSSGNFWVLCWQGQRHRLSGKASAKEKHLLRNEGLTYVHRWLTQQTALLKGNHIPQRQASGCNTPVTVETQLGIKIV